MSRSCALPIALLTALLLPLAAARAQAAELTVLTAGAYKQVLVSLAPVFAARTGHTLRLDNATVGVLTKRIEDNEAFDLAVLSPKALDGLADKGLVRREGKAHLAKVGIGVCVPANAAAPDVSTQAAFVAALGAARKVAYIDPASGGSSGIYLAGLFERLGLADMLRTKSLLIQGGYVAEHVARGEADLGIHQISEILPVAGVKLAGPLPEALQQYTVYAAGVATRSTKAEEARALVDFLRGPEARDLLKNKGMLPAD